MRHSYIIYSPLYTDTSGGILVLHRLASLLRDAGETVRLWPFDLPAPDNHSMHSWVHWYRKRLKRFLRGRSVKSPLHIPLAKATDVSQSIVVYPEIVSGNPLGSKRVVRWLLNKPSPQLANTYGHDECFFYFLPQFDVPEATHGDAQQLHVLELMRELYMNTNKRPRDQVCYMVRKGKDRSLDQHPSTAKCLDGLPHKQIAKCFSQSHMFISYDLYTFYSRYAAMSGCISVVVPQPGLSKTQWRPEEMGRLGIAYGIQDIDWAVQTRDRLLSHLDEAESDSRRSVERFVQLTQSRFSNDAVSDNLKAEAVL